MEKINIISGSMGEGIKFINYNSSFTSRILTYAMTHKGRIKFYRTKNELAVSSEQLEETGRRKA